ncbi:hypothetical protein [Sulfurovum sp.]|uniref:hypothetical protein n=1 Tax=Sulfurovum sp. TaxID=1969726 RepID=UPI0035638C8B
MKTLLIVSIVSLLPVYMLANAETPNHTEINKQIEEIKPSRTGVLASDVLKTESPFILVKTDKDGKKTTYAVKKKVKLPPLKLESAINKSVKINGKWYKEGDRIRQYTITKVSTDEVLLTSKSKELKLFQNHANDKIDFNVN